MPCKNILATSAAYHPLPRAAGLFRSPDLNRTRLRRLPELLSAACKRRTSYECVSPPTPLRNLFSCQLATAAALNFIASHARRARISHRQWQSWPGSRTPRRSQSGTPASPCQAQRRRYSVVKMRWTGSTGTFPAVNKVGVCERRLVLLMPVCLTILIWAVMSAPYHFLTGH